VHGDGLIHVEGQDNLPGPHRSRFQCIQLDKPVAHRHKERSCLVGEGNGSSILPDRFSTETALWEIAPA
jgi:hypothetical protein